MRYLQIKLLVLLFLLLVCIAVTFSVLHRNSTEKNYKNEPGERSVLEDQLFNLGETDFTIGTTSPRIRLVVYADTDCPYCKEFESSISQLLENFPNDVAVTYRQYKLPIYPMSHYEHLALECVGILHGADTYRAFQDEILYETNLEGIENPLEVITQQAIAFTDDLNRNELIECINNPLTQVRISRKIETANILGVRKTPTWFIVTPEGKRTKYVGTVSYEELTWLISANLGSQL